jgi:hypothetical protein
MRPKQAGGARNIGWRKVPGLSEAIVFVTGIFSIRPQGRTTANPLEDDLAGSPKGETAISPEEADFSIAPKGRT